MTYNWSNNKMIGVIRVSALSLEFCHRYSQSKNNNSTKWQTDMIMNEPVIGDSHIATNWSPGDEHSWKLPTRMTTVALPLFAEIRAESLKGDRDIIMDAAGVEVVNSAGVGMLLSLAQSLKSQGRRLQIKNCHGELQTFLNIVGQFGDDIDVI